MRRAWIMAKISCGEGDWPAIAHFLLSNGLQELRRLLLGESEAARLRGGQTDPPFVLVLHLSQSRWHRLARLLTGRASFHRRWLARHRGYAELRSYWP